MKQEVLWVLGFFVFIIIYEEVYLRFFKRPADLRSFAKKFGYSFLKNRKPEPYIHDFPLREEWLYERKRLSNCMEKSIAENKIVVFDYLAWPMEGAGVELTLIGILSPSLNTAIFQSLAVKFPDIRIETEKARCLIYFDHTLLEAKKLQDLLKFGG